MATSLLLCVPTVVWSQLSWGLGSSIHKYQAAAFSSIIVVIYKVHALHFLTPSLQKAPALFDHVSADPTQLFFSLLNTRPPSPSLARQRSLRSRHGCCLFLLLTFPVSQLWDLLYWPHLHISNLQAQVREINAETALFNTDALGGKIARERRTWTWAGALNTNVTALAISSAFKHWEVERGGVTEATALTYIHMLTLRRLCSLTFILSYTAAAFSGSLLWCLKANSVSTIPGDIHCTGQCKNVFQTIHPTRAWTHALTHLKVSATASAHTATEQRQHNLPWLWCECLLLEALAVSPQSKRSQRIWWHSRNAHRHLAPFGVRPYCVGKKRLLVPTFLSQPWVKPK